MGFVYSRGAWYILKRLWMGNCRCLQQKKGDIMWQTLMCFIQLAIVPNDLASFHRTTCMLDAKITWTPAHFLWCLPVVMEKFPDRIFIFITMKASATHHAEESTYNKHINKKTLHPGPNPATVWMFLAQGGKGLVGKLAIYNIYNVYNWLIDVWAGLYMIYIFPMDDLYMYMIQTKKRCQPVTLKLPIPVLHLEFCDVGSKVFIALCHLSFERIERCKQPELFL